MEWSTLRYEKEDRVAYVVLDRPSVLNAVNNQMGADLAETCRLIAEDKSTQVVVFKGEGRAFCSGLDLRAAASKIVGTGEVDDTLLSWPRALDFLESLNKLTIASIHGPCLGAGLELALVCDFRIATSTAVFALPQVVYGSVPDTGPAYRLPQLIGLAKAKEIAILGERFDAMQADRMGLLYKIVEPQGLAEETQKLVQRCLQIGSKASILTKDLLHRAHQLDSQALAAEITQARRHALETGEFTQSMQVYRERHKPRV
jgi:enoyl-CoA hydratase/carnithine racemase